MFGKNPVAKKSWHSSLILQVREIFHTIQGEGPHAGLPATFIRLTGCPLRCAFCDTVWSDTADQFMDVRDIVAEALSKTPPTTKLFVITGGEPFRQNIQQLLFLLGMGRPDAINQIETSGVLSQPAFAASCEIVVSPKTPKIHRDVAERAVAWKYVISSAQEIGMDGLPVGLARPLKGTPTSRVYLSPMDEYDVDKNRWNRQRCAELSMKHGYRLMLQLHKLVGVE